MGKALWEMLGVIVSNSTEPKDKDKTIMAIAGIKGIFLMRRDKIQNKTLTIITKKVKYDSALISQFASFKIGNITRLPKPCRCGPCC